MASKAHEREDQTTQDVVSKALSLRLHLVLVTVLMHMPAL